VAGRRRTVRRVTFGQGFPPETAKSRNAKPV